MQTTTIQITGYRDEPVPNTFLRQDGDTRHVAILLPGIGYTCDLPLLYYPMRLLLDRGADVLRVEYSYGRRDDYASLSQEERGRWLFADVAAACEAALGQRVYDRVTLVGKSLGTIAMAHLLTTDPRFAQASAVWLTPLLTNDAVRAQIVQWGGRSLFAIGTADPFYDADGLAEVRAATGGEAVVVDGADHSLEIAGDVMRSLAAVTQFMEALHWFVGQDGETTG